MLNAIIKELSRAGVEFLDPNTTYIGPDVEIEQDTIIYPSVVLLGKTKIGKNSKIHPFTYISDSRIGNDCKIWARVSMYNTWLGDGVEVHGDTRLVWSIIGSTSTVQSRCGIKYASVDCGCEIGPDATIEGEKFSEQTLASGKRSIRIAELCTIGVQAYIHDWATINARAWVVRSEIARSFIGKRVVVHGARIDDSKVHRDTIVDEGAWIHKESLVRHGCELARCEIVRSTLGTNTVAKHCSYIGDVRTDHPADINIGAGTVFANYDGENKRETYLEEGVFTGINSSIAITKGKRRIGRESMIGAGSTITGEVPPNTLAISRHKGQTHKKGWVRRTKTGWEIKRPPKKRRGGATNE